MAKKKVSSKKTAKKQQKTTGTNISYRNAHNDIFIGNTRRGWCGGYEG